MHCVRRAALRAACSSSRFVAVPRQQVATFALQLSKANVQPIGSLHLSRYFSQTAPVAEGKEFGESGFDGAFDADGNPTSEAPLQSSPTENERAAKNGTSIFISNMTFDATEVHIQEAFGKYGDILATNVARDGRGLSRGFAFVTFADKEAANRAVNEANNSFWHGRRILVDHRKEGPSGRGTAKTGSAEPTNSLYIGNIPYEASDADLNTMFRSLENVTDVRVAVDRNTGWPRGFAHADFVDVDSAIKAHEKLLQYSIGGRSLRVDYAEHRPANAKRSGSSTGSSSGSYGSSSGSYGSD
ncbi:RNA-binding domain-containing protein [Nemania serpens]|nr:RNA-binding domain-containing protein [Nemania serpens]